MSKQQTYHEKNKEKCLEKGRRYEETKKEWLHKMIHDQYRELSDEENDKEREYTRKRY